MVRCSISCCVLWILLLLLLTAAGVLAITAGILHSSFTSAQMLAAISLHLDEISRSSLNQGGAGGVNIVEGGVGRMKHLRGKRKRLQQFLEESMRRERREEEEKEERDISWSRKVKKIGLDALFS